MYTNAGAIALEDVDSSYIVNNVFYGHNTQYQNTFHVHYSDGCTNAVLRNNIFYTDLNYDSNGRGIAVYVDSTQDHTAIDADYNVYYRINNALRVIQDHSTTYHMNELALVRSNLGWEAHGQFINPLFVNAPDNFHLQAGSPALGAGINLPWVIYDRDGNLYDSPPSAGIYEDQ